MYKYTVKVKPYKNICTFDDKSCDFLVCAGPTYTFECILFKESLKLDAQDEYPIRCNKCLTAEKKAKK